MDPEKQMPRRNLEPTGFVGQVHDIGQFGIADEGAVPAVISNMKTLAFLVINPAVEFGNTTIRYDDIIGLIPADGERTLALIDDIFFSVKQGHQGHGYRRLVAYGRRQEFIQVALEICHRLQYVIL